MYHPKKRKKVSGHKRHHRRRRVGAAGKGALEMLVGVVGGALIGRFAYTSVQGLPAYALQVVEIMGGGAIAIFMGQQPLLQGIGIGLLAEGSVQTATQAIPGMNGVGSNLTSRQSFPGGVGGFYDVPRVGGLAGFYDVPRVGAAKDRTSVMMGRAYKNVYQ